MKYGKEVNPVASRKLTHPSKRQSTIKRLSSSGPIRSGNIVLIMIANTHSTLCKNSLIRKDKLAAEGKGRTISSIEDLVDRRKATIL